MIIMGYPGVGKSTLAVIKPYVIDLESSCFMIDGKRSEDWYKVYVNIAKDLSKQGKVVFLSSHKLVQDEVKRVIDPKDYFILYPQLSCKQSWVQKLKNRAEITGSSKDKRAYESVERFFDDHIKEIESSFDDYNKMIIQSTDYNLEILVERVYFGREKK